MGFSQDINAIDVILAYTGVNSPEELDNYEYERLLTLINNPLNINVNQVNKFVTCGVFTSYQAASLMDYRLRHGDVMSFTELASLDGFNEEFVRKISPFISLTGGDVMGFGQDSCKNELILRGGLKTTFLEGADYGYGLKYSLDTSSGIFARAGFTRSYSSGSVYPDSFSLSIGCDFSGIPISVIFGDFNARFGQGLSLWNGMSMSGLSSPSSLMKRPSGLSPASSFSGSQAMTGAATSIMLRNFTFNMSLALPDIKTFTKELSLLPAVNVLWNHRYGQVGITHYLDFNRYLNDSKTSMDMAWCIRGADVFMEIAYDWKSQVPAALAGVAFPVGDALRLGTMVRAYPSAYDSSRSGAQRSTTKCSNEYSCTFAGEFMSQDRVHSAALSADIAYFPEPKLKGNFRDGQLKFNGKWECSKERWILKMNISERVRSWGEPFRTDLRSDFSILWRSWSLTLRANLLHCVNLAGLGYAEAVYKTDKLTVCGRCGIFFVDDWEDRIYVYEREAPGGFNIPAMYGRGVWAAAYSGFNLSWHVKFYLRAAVTSYPFMPQEKRKPGRAELKLQCMFSF